jgi:hypothetical protein
MEMVQELDALEHVVGGAQVPAGVSERHGP